MTATPPPGLGPAFEGKLATLASFAALDADLVGRFGEALRERDDWGLRRVNPLRFAADHELGERDAVELFVHAARIGLFDLEWNLLCPSCGSVEHSHAALDELPGESFPCVICGVDVPTTLDDRVEVAFTISPGVHRLAIDPFADAAAYRRWFFSSSFVRSEEHLRYLGDVTRGFVSVPARAEATLRLEAEAGRSYRLLSIDHHSVVHLDADAGADATAAPEIHMLPGGLAPARVSVRPGPVEITVRSLRDEPTGGVLVLSDMPRLERIFATTPPRFAPFLTAKRLLNNQSFRELFRAQPLERTLHLSVRSITLLFTDLRGSTELYDRTGDLYAYGLIQEHFTRLAEAVGAHEGAIVKTMGDAIMASFSAPADGVRAALRMAGSMRELNAGLRERGHELGLKVGIHEGPALAVNQNDRIDYFGQTVNVAARVQGQASAGEILLTAPVADAGGGAAILAEAGWSGEPVEVSLKGVAGETTVHRYTSGR